MGTTVTMQFEIKDLEYDNEEDMTQAVLDYIFMDGFPSEVTDDLDFEIVSTWETDEDDDESEDDNG